MGTGKPPRRTDGGHFLGDVLTKERINTGRFPDRVRRQESVTLAGHAPR